MIITVLDTETTGLNRSEHEIIEIALISYIIAANGDKYVLKTFESKIKPGHIESASPEALKINGYSEEAWSSAPRFEEVYLLLFKNCRNILFSFVPGVVSFFRISENSLLTSSNTKSRYAISVTNSAWGPPYGRICGDRNTSKSLFLESTNFANKLD